MGQNKFLSDIEAVTQAIKTRMALLYSEWWEDTEDGLPLFEKILGRLGGDENKNAVDLIISQRILGTTGVKEIVNYSSVLEYRNYSAECMINTIYGEVNLSLSDNSKKLVSSFATRNRLRRRVSSRYGGDSLVGYFGLILTRQDFTCPPTTK